MPSALLASVSATHAEAQRPAAPVSTDLVDLLLLLAAAFAPPPAALSARDWCEPLAHDLADLGIELGLDTSTAQDSLRDAATGAPAGEPWLVEYSRLFLVPPVRVTLNTGIYLEGGLAGTSAQMMAQCYATAGFAPRESFRDLPDHVVIQLEFLAALVERSAHGDPSSLAMACEFAEGFASYWIDPLRIACEKACDRCAAAPVYVALTSVLRQALDRGLR